MGPREAKGERALSASPEDSVSGRWLSPDPLGGDLTNPQSLNRYAYVMNNPTTLTDPTGLCGEPDQWDPTTNTVRGSSPCPPSWQGMLLLESCIYAGWGCGYGSQGDSYNYAGGGAGATSSGTPPPPTKPPAPKQPQSPTCSQQGFGFGLSGGGNADAGLGFTGATSTGSVDGGFFHNSQSGWSSGSVAGGGAAAYFLNHVAAAPTQGNQPLSVLAYGGAGLSAFVTNAGSAQQLAGPFTTYSVNVGVGPFKATGQLSYSDGTWVLSFGPPYTGAGLGLSFSRVTTTAAVLGSTCH